MSKIRQKLRLIRRSQSWAVFLGVFWAQLLLSVGLILFLTYITGA